MGEGFCSITQILRQAIIENTKSQEPRIRPSTLGNCPRQVYYSILLPQEAASDEDNEIARGFFISGKLHEELIAPYMQKAGFHYQCYIKIIPDDDPNFYGHCDFYKYDERTQMCYIVDIKTTGYKSISYLPKQSHITQIMLYLHGAIHGEVWLTNENGDLIEKMPPAKGGYGCIFYIIRENPALTFDGQEFWFEYDAEEANALLAHKKALSLAIQKKTLPPIPASYSPFSYPCMYVSDITHKEATCPYWKLCWENVVSGRVSDVNNELRSLAERLIALYVAKEKAEEEYNQLAAKLRDVILKDTPTMTIYTPHGEVRKVSITKKNVSWKRLVNCLVDDGIVSRDVMEKAISNATEVKQTSYISVKPFPTLSSSIQKALHPLDERGEDNDSSSL